VKTDPATYEPHALHGAQRIWVEKNCYVDIWIAALHSLGLEPLAMLGGTLRLDFVDDQWTFYKPDHADLRRLYGVQVEELTVWRPLAEHVRTHLQAGRWISVEVDSFWLPDTAATDYRQAHGKTTILIVRDDPAGERLTYFHNAGLFTLAGEDYRQVMANSGLPLPLLAEWVDARRVRRLPHDHLRRLATENLREHLTWLPTDNPVARFAHWWRADVTQRRQPTAEPAAAAGEARQHHPPDDAARAIALAGYHASAFAGTRQLGACMELLALHLRWLGGHDAAAQHLEAASQAAKALILKGARAVSSRRPWTADDTLDELATTWSLGRTALKASLDGAC
jgi:hypothetical protein